MARPIRRAAVPDVTCPEMLAFREQRMDLLRLLSRGPERVSASDVEDDGFYLLRYGRKLRDLEDGAPLAVRRHSFPPALRKLLPPGGPFDVFEIDADGGVRRRGWAVTHG